MKNLNRFLYAGTRTTRKQGVVLMTVLSVALAFPAISGAAPQSGSSKSGSASSARSSSSSARSTSTSSTSTRSTTTSSASTRPTTKEGLRNHIENTAQRTFDEHGKPMTVTSRDRNTPKSAAHDRGAIDVRGTDPTIARDISRKLGKGYLAQTEQPGHPPVSPNHQLTTAYINGKPLYSKSEPKRADAPHTHIQPNKNPNDDAPTPREYGTGTTTIGGVTVCADCGRGAKEFGSEAAFQKHLKQGHATKLKNQAAAAKAGGKTYPNPRPNAPTPRR